MTRATRYTLILLTTVSLAFSQGANPTTPSKEYIRLGGSIIAIENAAPAVSLSPTTINFGGRRRWTAYPGAGIPMGNTHQTYNIVVACGGG